MCAIVFYAFDLLELKGEYLRGSPLLKRRGQELAITTTLILEGFTELK
jgi:ATP-dependent DNA ligase